MRATDIVYLNGRRFDRATASALLEVDRRATFTNVAGRITQGSYSGAVGASAGTHAKAGAVDEWLNALTEKQKRKLEQIHRDVGFAAWIRRAIPGLWNEHLHAILWCDQITVAPAAARQITAYRNERDGLAGNRHDTAWRPKGGPKKYVWAEQVKTYNLPASKRRYDVKRGKTAYFRRAADENAAVVYTRTRGPYVFDKKCRVGGRLWYRHASTLLWVNAATLTPAR